MTTYTELVEQVVQARKEFVLLFTTLTIHICLIRYKGKQTLTLLSTQDKIL